MKKSQTIKCDVHTCKHCDCNKDICNLDEIKVENQMNDATNKDDTICSNYIQNITEK